LVGSHRCRLSVVSPDHVSALSRRAIWPVSGRLSTIISGRALIDSSWVPAAFRPPAFASWSSCARPGVEPSSRSAYRHANSETDPDGVSVFRTHELRSGWVPSLLVVLRDHLVAVEQRCPGHAEVAVG
jgi:hypothetical protein